VKTLNVLHNCLTAHTRMSKMNNSNTPNSFNWDLVRSFLAALDHGSLLAAARALHSSQPTIGRHIAELESQLGTVLFERTGRGLNATAAARKLADAARAMETGALQLAQQVSGAQAGVQGTVRISASQPVASVLLPPILMQMRQSLPEVQIEVVSTNQVSNLLRREADIAVRMVRPEQSSLVAKKIGALGLGIYAHRSYLQRHGTPVTPADLLSHSLVGDDTIGVIQRGFLAAGYDVPREAFAVRSDDLIVQWQMVRAGVGIGFIADYMGRSDPDLLRVVPSIQVPPLPMWLAVHREIRTSPRIRKVYDLLASALPVML
jgi:DNA-binding transcriptional LysR family regulator